jgi:hypothetical protein
VSPILVRPVREQFEHDRVIRVLQAKYKRKYEVAINPGAEQNAAVAVGDLTMYPDLVLFSPERARRIQGTVEVETTESINTLEAMSEWGPYSRLRAPFFLYVPATTIDTVRRLCTEHRIDPAEIWTYHAAIDQVRFTMVHRSPNAPKGSIDQPRPKPEPAKTDVKTEAVAAVNADVTSDARAIKNAIKKREKTSDQKTRRKGDAQADSVKGERARPSKAGSTEKAQAARTVKPAAKAKKAAAKAPAARKIAKKATPKARATKARRR